MLALEAGKARPVPGSRPGRSVLALTSGTAQLGPVNFQPLPASVVTRAQAQIAEITG